MLKNCFKASTSEGSLDMILIFEELLVFAPAILPQRHPILVQVEHSSPLLPQVPHFEDYCA